jgi:hypothetical protein
MPFDTTAEASYKADIKNRDLSIVFFGNGYINEALGQGQVKAHDR